MDNNEENQQQENLNVPNSLPPQQAEVNQHQQPLQPMQPKQPKQPKQSTNVKLSSSARIYYIISYLISFASIGAFIITKDYVALIPLVFSAILFSRGYAKDGAKNNTYPSLENIQKQTRKMWKIVIVSSVIFIVVLLIAIVAFTPMDENELDSTNLSNSAKDTGWNSAEETIQGLTEWSESLTNPEYLTEQPGNSYLTELPLSIRKVYGVRFQESDVTKAEIEKHIISKGFSSSDLIAPEDNEYYSENTYTNQYLLCQTTHSEINNFDGLNCVSLASYTEALNQQSAINAKIESIKNLSGIEINRIVWEKDDKNINVDYIVNGSSKEFPLIYLTRTDIDSDWTFVKEVEKTQ